VNIKRRKDAADRREIIVTMRVNEEESKALESAVTQTGLSQSDILRTALRSVIRGMVRGLREAREQVEQEAKAKDRTKGLTAKNGTGHK